MDCSEDDPTRFSADCLPSDPRLWATVTNSYLGTRIYHDTIHINGVYSGAGGDTHRAILPSPLNVHLEAPAGTEQLTETFTLDTNTGSFLHTLESSSFRASQCIYAHRVLPHVLVFSVSIARLTTGNEPITVPLRADFSPESPDLDLHVGPDFQGLRYLHGHTLIPEHPGEPRQEVHMLWVPVPPALTLGEDEKDRTWEFVTVVGSSQAEAQGCYAEALQLQTRGVLYTPGASSGQAVAWMWLGPWPCARPFVGLSTTCSVNFLSLALKDPSAMGLALEASPMGVRRNATGAISSGIRTSGCSQIF